jgi:hypothetical protein
MRLVLRLDANLQFKTYQKQFGGNMRIALQVIIFAVVLAAGASEAMASGVPGTPAEPPPRPAGGLALSQ